MAEPKVHIHAQFPKVVQPNTQPDLDPTNWVWRQCLTFPVNELNHLEFSSRPYKWMRYATGIVIGARGELGRDRETPTPMNYEDDPPADSITLYYHTTDQAKLSMFPIDPQLAGSRTGTSEGSSSRRGAFCSDVEGRDATCVVTREPPRVCQAAHLLPHSKGDEVRLLHDITIPYSLIGTSISRRSPDSELETSTTTMSMTILYKILMTFATVCS